jgi:DNA helicase-2/ATP-dependent DNA helicase PcrA
MGDTTSLNGLNPAQRRAVEHGLGALRGEEPGALRGEKPGAARPGPLLVIAGAGSGKTNTLAHRVAHLILHGADPQRILLLTFTRRAAAEMTRRAKRILAGARAAAGDTAARGEIRWSGTFHGVASRLLRLHAESVGLDPSFTVLDPRKATCLAIYSHAVNAQRPVEETLEHGWPWCQGWSDELRQLFAAYAARKQQLNVLDYDDLLLYWHFLMEEPALARLVGERFDHVLVDEYQDTNALQAGILLRLEPEGAGLTVVGDDAQSIYSFRAATVRNILDFPSHFDGAEHPRLPEPLRPAGHRRDAGAELPLHPARAGGLQRGDLAGP